MNKKKKINLEERIKIEINYCVKFISLREIARILDRDVSSISREIGDKTRGSNNKYQAHIAHAKSLERRAKRKKKELLKCVYIREYVVKHLKMNWTPEQISGRLKKDSNGEYTISYEAIEGSL